MGQITKKLNYTSQKQLCRDIQNHADFTDTVLIVISDDNDNFLSEYERVFADVLVVEFMDTQMENHPRAMKRQHAAEIKDFILKHADKNILVQCDQGESRSVAVVCAVHRYRHELREELLLWYNPRLHPNILVYSLMCKAFGIKFPMTRFRHFLNRYALKRKINMHK